MIRAKILTGLNYSCKNQNDLMNCLESIHRSKNNVIFSKGFRAECLSYTSINIIGTFKCTHT